MGFNFHRFISHPVHSIVKAVKNPAAKIIPHNIRKTKVYKKIGRPIIKIGAGIAIGAATGGIGLAGGAVVFSGLSIAGAVAGGVSSALAGGTTSKGFKPIKNGLLPAVSGLVAGNVARNFTAIKAATNTAKQAATAAIKKEAARVLAQAKAATSAKALLTTAGTAAGSKLAKLAKRKPQVLQSATAPAAPAVQTTATDKAAKNGNSIALATLAAVAVSVMAS